MLPQVLWRWNSVSQETAPYEESFPKLSHCSHNSQKQGRERRDPAKESQCIVNRIKGIGSPTYSRLMCPRVIRELDALPAALSEGKKIPN